MSKGKMGSFVMFSQLTFWFRSETSLNDRWRLLKKLKEFSDEGYVSVSTSAASEVKVKFELECPRWKLPRREAAGKFYSFARMKGLEGKVKAEYSRKAVSFYHVPVPDGAGSLSEKLTETWELNAGVAEKVFGCDSGEIYLAFR